MYIILPAALQNDSVFIQPFSELYLSNFEARRTSITYQIFLCYIFYHHHLLYNPEQAYCILYWCYIGRLLLLF
jgi:hypothetical protein